MAFQSASLTRPRSRSEDDSIGARREEMRRRNSEELSKPYSDLYSRDRNRLTPGTTNMDNYLDRMHQNLPAKWDNEVWIKKIKEILAASNLEFRKFISESTNLIQDSGLTLDPEDYSVDWDNVFQLVLNRNWKELLNRNSLKRSMYSNLAFRTYLISGDKNPNNLMKVSHEVVQNAEDIKGVAWLLNKIVTEYLCHYKDYNLEQKFIDLFKHNPKDFSPYDYVILDNYLHCVFKLNHNVSNEKRKSFNNKLLKEHYLQEIDLLTNLNKILERYKDNPTKEIYDETVSRLMHEMRNIVKTNDYPEVYIRFLEKGGPILIDGGEVFSKAVSMWKLPVLKAISKSKLNKYMKYKMTAMKLLDSIANLFIDDSTIFDKIDKERELKKDYDLLQYLVTQDKRDNKSESIAYNHFKNSLKNQSGVSKKIKAALVKNQSDVSKRISEIIF